MLSKIIFIASTLNVPSPFLDQVNKLISNFIWIHEPPQIKQSTMIGNIKDGGLSMPDFRMINKSLKTGWVKRLLNTSTQSVQTIPFNLLQHVGGPFLFICNFSVKTLPKLPLLPHFYYDVLSVWEGIVMHTPTTRKEIENEILWNNHLITIGGKSVFYKQWHDAGVETLSDILDKDGSFLSFSKFKKKYNIKTNFLHYLGLCNAIQKHWRKAFDRNFEKESACTVNSTRPKNHYLMTC